MERVNRWKTYTDEQLEEVEKVSSRYKSCLDAGKTASVLQLIWPKKPDTKILWNM